MQQDWTRNAIFYHVYPLGFCDALYNNDHNSVPQARLEKISSWIPHLKELGINALYLGPLFESSQHGYDTADYYHVDRRLGTDETLTQLIQQLHTYGIRVILDGVFNHVGRNFWAFRDVLQNGQNSQFCNWFAGLNFDQRSPQGDPFTYDTWQGHSELVKLNLHNPQTRQHLFGAVKQWILDFGIDGLRLDTADCLDLDFQKELSAFTHSLRPDFWLMGEVIHGDYRRWANPETLDSVTNYESYKGLYSSFVDKNFFEIAFSLNRQFGSQGIYQNLRLYNFVDNHDVDRVASKLENQAHLHPLYCLLFSMPGIPSIYYGSEWGLKGNRTKNSDQALRPTLDLEKLRKNAPDPHLPATIQKLSRIRSTSPALQDGDYQQLLAAPEQLVFTRQAGGQTLIVQINAADEPAQFDLAVPWDGSAQLNDLLNEGETSTISNGRLINTVYPQWARILSFPHQ